MLATPYDDTVRDGQIETMRHLVRQASGPVLVLCDCNMSDQSTAYHDLDRLLDDSFREVGQGLGLSATRFLANRRVFPLMARIDYVWHSADFRAYAAFVADDSGSSDHHPVVARLALHAQHAD
jgi:vancomycin resistance protein VanJ